MHNKFKPGDWSELKQKAFAAADEFGSYDPAEAEIEFISAIKPEVVLALIAENERLCEDHDKQWRLAQSGIQNTEAVLAENAKLRAEVEALRGSCKALGRENTLLTRRAKKAERAVLWFAGIKPGFLRPKWLVAVIDSLKGGRADG
jgi:hypothetical protein